MGHVIFLSRPNAVSLVDAFDMHDETVASALGQYDGNAYQHLFESTQYEPNNSTEVNIQVLFRFHSHGEISCSNILHRIAINATHVQQHRSEY